MVKRKTQSKFALGKDPKRQICIVSSGMGEMPPELTFNQVPQMNSTR